MKLKLLDRKTMLDFPAVSDIEFLNDQLYMAGKDCGDLIVLTKRWSEVERITLSEPGSESVSGEVSQDDITLAYTEQQPHVLVTNDEGPEHGGKFCFYDLNHMQVLRKDLSIFLDRLPALNISRPDVSISAIVKENMVFAGYSEQDSLPYLVVTDADFWKKQEEAETLVLPLDAETADGLQLLALTYSNVNDWLIFAATKTNADSDAHHSQETNYLGVIENASRKIGRKKIKVNELFELGEVDEGFFSSTVQCLCVQKEAEDRARIQLAAINKEKATVFFKFRLRS